MQRVPPARRAACLPRRFERLERRQLLTAAPRIENVLVSSSQWSGSFLDYLESENLGAGGYAIPAGSSDQMLALPWSNINRLSIQFDQDVSVDRNDLAITGAATIQHLASAFEYDPVARLATWSFASPLTRDKLLVDLDGNGLDPLQNAAEQELDGEWINAGSTFKSGNGLSGGDFEFRLNVLPGDANRTNSVTNGDATGVADRLGLNTASEGYSPFHDIDGDGAITSLDAGVVSAAHGTSLPLGMPVGMTNDPPSAAWRRSISTIEDAADYVLSLWDEFDDAETPDDALTYEILSNSNPSLFAGTSIDTATGNLALSLAPDQFGSAEIQVAATDQGGLRVIESVEVDVVSDNDVPRIDGFEGHITDSPNWTFTGTVVDENPGGRTVTFGGILAGHTATTNADGTFSISVELSSGGIASAQTTDQHGASSGPVFVSINWIVQDPGPPTSTGAVASAMSGESPLAGVRRDARRDDVATDARSNRASTRPLDELRASKRTRRVADAVLQG